MKEYRCYSYHLENYLLDHRLQPIRYEGDTAIFKKSQELQNLLDLYWRQHKVFKEI